MGIAEEADVEHEVSLRRHAAAVGEGEHEDRRRMFGLRLEAGGDHAAQIADREPAGIDGQIGLLAEPAEQRTLALDALVHRPVEGEAGAGGGFR